MPELPEVETVRRGLQRYVAGRRIAAVDVLHVRAVRRHGLGREDFEQRLPGLTVTAVRRRGKYLWLPLSAAGRAAERVGEPSLIAHLGMSGQLLMQTAERPDPVHLRARVRFADDGPELRFVDQRTFGGLVLDDLVATPDVPDQTVPGLVAHIGRDPLDPAFDDRAFSRRLRRSTSTVKRALLDQSLVSGVGNIYADESLWRTRLHGRRLGRALRATTVAELLGHVRAVLVEALGEGGTSFDTLYVNVNGQSGYFDRSLAVYGRPGAPCRRCGTPVQREAFMNRSSFFCPRCQPEPRPRRSGV
ncbi:MAG: bifunctional DNA-formamidopyrimidine glycosylase/DNA-(apurinic or apyrimidinic site) lyase [Actinomycetota bacterium]|nr:bifunctional DNA-formamidopyrimidine glycosylase/DNA-(apurinic or apyrimidinic site) lyase [Actinomycetota bacterium]